MWQNQDLRTGNSPQSLLLYYKLMMIILTSFLLYNTDIVDLHISQILFECLELDICLKVQDLCIIICIISLSILVHPFSAQHSFKDERKKGNLKWAKGHWRMTGLRTIRLLTSIPIFLPVFFVFLTLFQALMA